MLIHFLLVVWSSSASGNTNLPSETYLFEMRDSTVVYSAQDLSIHIVAKGHTSGNFGVKWKVSDKITQLETTSPTAPQGYDGTGLYIDHIPQQPMDLPRPVTFYATLGKRFWAIFENQRMVEVPLPQPETFAVTVDPNGNHPAFKFVSGFFVFQGQIWGVLQFAVESRSKRDLTQVYAINPEGQILDLGLFPVLYTEVSCFLNNGGVSSTLRPIVTVRRNDSHEDVQPLVIYHPINLGDQFTPTYRYIFLNGRILEFEPNRPPEFDNIVVDQTYRIHYPAGFILSQTTDETSPQVEETFSHIKINTVKTRLPVTFFVTGDHHVHVFFENASQAVEIEIPDLKHVLQVPFGATWTFDINIEYAYVDNKMWGILMVAYQGETPQSRLFAVSEDGKIRDLGHVDQSPGFLTSEIAPSGDLEIIHSEDGEILKKIIWNPLPIDHATQYLEWLAGPNYTLHETDLRGHRLPEFHYLLTGPNLTKPLTIRETAYGEFYVVKRQKSSNCAGLVEDNVGSI